MSERIVQVDLGCGAQKRLYPGATEYIGIDNHLTDITTHQCQLGFERIPLDDGVADIVTAHDFLEHIPFQLYVTPRLDGRYMGQVQKPMVDLFNEIFRILKHGGIFYSETPFFPNRSIFQDPTHVAVWTDETFHYFSGDYYGFHDVHGHKSRFVKERQEIAEPHHLCVTLRAIKNMPAGAKYEVTYPAP